MNVVTPVPPSTLPPSVTPPSTEVSSGERCWSSVPRPADSPEIMQTQFASIVGSHDVPLSVQVQFGSVAGVQLVPPSLVVVPPSPLEVDEPPVGSTWRCSPRGVHVE